ncbi:MAG TPA: hypothetical protein VM166_11335 [Gemmatimonadaceae bacterium]|nr:hypothetical protein [Gemmatimonadaceae bacterium]
MRSLKDRIEGRRYRNMVMRHLAVTGLALALFRIDSFAQTNAPTSLAPPARFVLSDPMAPSRDQGLELTLSASEAYDRNNLTPALQTSSQNGVLTTPVYLKGGLHTRGQASLNYSYGKQGVRSSFSANANSAMSAYSKSDRVLVTAGADIAEGLSLGPRTSIQATQTFSYAPFYNFALFQGSNQLQEANLVTSAIPNIDFAAVATQTYRYGLTSGLTHQMSKRSSLGFNYGVNYTDFGGIRGLIDQHAGVRYSQSLSQGLSLHLGYGHSIGDYAAIGVRPETHDIDIGVNYSKALSFSRRTTFGFSTGSTLMTGGSTASQAVTGRKDFRLTGSARLNHQIGRTWSARLSYVRGWNYVDGFTHPLFEDSATVGVGGEISQRVTAGASASYVYGKIGFSDQRYDSFSGSSVVRVAVSRVASVYAQYVFYRYQFPDPTALPPGFPSFFARNGARVGFSLRLPLVR